MISYSHHHRSSVHLGRECAKRKAKGRPTYRREVETLLRNLGKKRRMSLTIKLLTVIDPMIDLKGSLQASLVPINKTLFICASRIPQ